MITHMIIRFTFLALSAVGILTAEAHGFMQGPNQGYSMYPPYPYVLSQPIDNLPQGYITLGTIGMGQDTYYYFNGVFYQKVIREQVYVIVPPPIGAIVFNIPQGYRLMLIDGMCFYEAYGIFYRRVLEGYKVIYPPV